MREIYLVFFTSFLNLEKIHDEFHENYIKFLLFNWKINMLKNLKAHTFILMSLLSSEILSSANASASAAAAAAGVQSEEIIFDPSNVAARALQIYERINNDGKLNYPAADEAFCVHSDQWQVEYIHPGEDAPSKVRVPSLVKQKPIGPSDGATSMTAALEDLLDKGGRIECLFALHITMLFCAGSLGDHVSTLIEAEGKSISLGASEDPSTSPFKFLVDAGAPLMPQGDILPGTFGYISNAPVYRDIHPENRSFAAGYNVVCVGHNDNKQALYMSFDPNKEIFDKPRTFEEIQDHLYADLVKPIEETGIAGIDDLMEQMRASYDGEEGEKRFFTQALAAQKKYPSYTLRALRDEPISLKLYALMTDAREKERLKQLLSF